VYDHRLESLNNKAAEQARIQSTYLPRETYEADRRMLTMMAVGVLVSLLSSVTAVLIAAFWRP
jgi:hypothetical protein